MGKQISLFFDDGGVLSDNNVRGPQWRELVADYLNPRYGGTRDSWKKANEVVFGKFMEQYENNYSQRTDYDYVEFIDEQDILWLTGMFDFVGLPAPAPENQLSISRAVQQWVATRVRAAFPGIIDVVRDLWTQGYPLYTASGETSWMLKAHLQGMGLLDCFQAFYGPDLIRTAKGGPLFYQRTFTHATIDPQTAIVIEDRPRYLEAAKTTGAQVIQSCVTGDYTPMVPYYYEHSNELPQLIMEVTNSI
ncbi:MAG: HAD family hydrolase [Candidatus Heimdallarchaeota archaeon]